MRYSRRFVIHACHFNGQKEYDAWNRISRTEYDFEDMMTCIRGVHGHNFIITVTAQGMYLDQHFLVDDSIIESIVLRWNNVNLSAHEDFAHTRATTERMVDTLIKHLKLVDRHLHWTVKIDETDSVSAEDSR